MKQVFCVLHLLGRDRSYSRFLIRSLLACNVLVARDALSTIIVTCAWETGKALNYGEREGNQSEALANQLIPVGSFQARGKKAFVQRGAKSIFIKLFFFA